MLEQMTLQSCLCLVYGTFKDSQSNKKEKKFALSS